MECEFSRIHYWLVFSSHICEAGDTSMKKTNLKDHLLW